MPPSVPAGSARAVVAQFARIHVANLVNFGIVPLTFSNLEDYDSQGAKVSIDVSDLEGGLRLEVDRQRLLLDPAFEPKNCPS